MLRQTLFCRMLGALADISTKSGPAGMSNRGSRASTWSDVGSSGEWRRPRPGWLSEGDNAGRSQYWDREVPTLRTWKVCTNRVGCRPAFCIEASCHSTPREQLLLPMRNVQLKTLVNNFACYLNLSRLLGFHHPHK